MKFTFKKGEKSTGLARVAEPYPVTHIKLNKKKIGQIRPPNSNNNEWAVSISVKKSEPDDNPNCDWKWLKLKVSFAQEKIAREWVKHNLEDIIKYNDLELHSIEM
jgi:hypothetical protein